KNTASDLYRNGLEDKKTVAMAEIDDKLSDIMKVNIGNIPSKTEIKIVLSYIEKLEVVLNKFWSFKIYSTITPRYHPDPTKLNEDLCLLINYPLISENNEESYPWKIEIEVESSSSINLIK